MKKRMLQNIEVSEIGMGCMAFSHGYGQIPPESYSIEAIQGAYEHGCTFFDTAEVYSPNLSGIGHIRMQESDRIAAILSELTRMGISCGGGIHVRKIRTDETE